MSHCTPRPCSVRRSTDWRWSPSPPPRQPLDRDDLGVLIERVTAKTLILNGQHDEPAAYAAATWYKDHLASARVEMVPGDGELGLPAVWARVLAHVAPRTKR